MIVAGGGPAAIEFALALRERAGDRVALELIAPDRELVVRAYEVLAPFHEGRERRYPMSRIAAGLGMRIIRDAVVEVDGDGRAVTMRSGRTRGYDALVVAVGARHGRTLDGAIPFRGARDADRLRALLIDSYAGLHRRVAFVVPAGPAWQLPVYELALHASAWLSERNVVGIPLALVTPEHEPLAVFGPGVSAEVASILAARDVQFVSGHAIRHEHGQLLLAGGNAIDCALAIALPRLDGPRLPGLPCDAHGFIPVDDRGRVDGLERVFAAGDATTFPVKHGGLAAQQADAVAELIAGELGGSAEPELGASSGSSGFQPVLRAVLFAGGETRYLNAELGERLPESSRASSTPLWPEQGKLVGRLLSPYLDHLEQTCVAARSVVATEAAS